MNIQTTNKNQNILQIQKMNDFETIQKELEELDDNALFYEAKKQIEFTRP